MADIEIVIIKRPHQWLVKRDQPGIRTCKICGRRAEQVATAVCYEEEVEREIPPQVDE